MSTIEQPSLMKAEIATTLRAVPEQMLFDEVERRRKHKLLKIDGWQDVFGISLSSATEAELFAEVASRKKDGLEDPQDWSDLLAIEDDEPDVAITPLVEDENALDEARARLQRGEHREALHHLAIALGRDFDRLEDILRDGGRW